MFFPFLFPFSTQVRGQAYSGWEWFTRTEDLLIQRFTTQEPSPPGTSRAACHCPARERDQYQSRATVPWPRIRNNYHSGKKCKLKGGTKSTWNKKDVSMAELPASLLLPIGNTPLEPPIPNIAPSFLYLAQAAGRSWARRNVCVWGRDCAEAQGGRSGCRPPRCGVSSCGPETAAEEGDVGVALSPQLTQAFTCHGQPEARQLLRQMEITVHFHSI